MEYVTTDNVAIVLLIGACIQLWRRLTVVEDRKTEIALQFATLAEQMRASIDKAIDKLDHRGQPRGDD